MRQHLVNANAVHIPLPNASVHCVVTSPPYYGHRQYTGVPSVVWPPVVYEPIAGLGPLAFGDTKCTHTKTIMDTDEERQVPTWGETIRLSARQDDSGTDDGVVGRQRGEQQGRSAERGQYCRQCGAWRGSLGHEPTLEMYTAHLVGIFREVWRVLHPTGTVWLNLGDSYGGSWGNYVATGSDSAKALEKCRKDRYGTFRPPMADRNSTQWKSKDLLMVPARVALALQADGWYVRASLPWVKPNGMPESVTDRPAVPHETWLLLSKSERYYFDYVAVQQPTVHGDGTRRWRNVDVWEQGLDNLIEYNRHRLCYLKQMRDDGGMLFSKDGSPIGLTFPVGNYGGDHYAAYNPNMIEPLIKASTSKAGACSKCGAPWGREVERHRACNGVSASGGWAQDEAGNLGPRSWQPSCDCGIGDPVPTTVLDPFVGTGTTLVVARKLGRRGVGLDMSHRYLAVDARMRLGWDILKDWQNVRNGNSNGHEEPENFRELPLFSMD